MHFNLKIFLDDVRHWWEASLFGRALLWMMLIYGILTVTVVIVELSKELLSSRPRQDSSNALLLLWGTAFILVTTALSCQRILTSIP